MTRVRTAFTVAVACSIAACDHSPPGPDLATESPAEARLPAHGLANVVDVTARHDHAAGEFRLELSADEIPSGWTTFRFDNQANQHHFGLISKVPEGITTEDYLENAQVFQNFMDAIIGRPLSFPETGFDIPAWAADVQFFGGPGLTAGGRSSQTTLNLEPGNYFVECYVKTPNGTFHTVLGMVAQFTVTEASSRARQPRSTLEMTLRNHGIEVEDEVRPGMHTVAVHFAEQMVHGNFVGTDVHLVRLDDGADLEELATWMNWMVPEGLATPAPAEFLGGSHDMAVGHTAYFTVQLKPGSYAWIAEVDDPDEKGLLKTFTVPFGRAGGR